MAEQGKEEKKEPIDLGIRKFKNQNPGKGSSKLISAFKNAKWRGRKPSK